LGFLLFLALLQPSVPQTIIKAAETIGAVVAYVLCWLSLLISAELFGRRRWEPHLPRAPLGKDFHNTAERVTNARNPAG
jgi:hypothetical protein